MININNNLLKISDYKPSYRGSNQYLKKLDWNELSIPLSKELNDLFIESIKDLNFNEYPEIHNENLITKLSKYCNVNTNNIQIFNGSDSALHNIFATYLNKESKVLVFYPNYNQIETYINLYCDNLKYSYITDIFNRHVYNFSDIQDSDVIYISNPNNPTGYCLKNDIILPLISQYPNKLFIIDEAYYEFSNESVSQFVNKYDNLVVTRTFSKAMSLASVRIGYICANENIIKNINKIRNTKEVNSISQKFAEIALDNLDKIKARINTVIDNRNFFVRELNDLGIINAKSESNFILIKVNNSKEFISECLNHDILVRDRSMFVGLKNCVRITIGEITTMKKIIEILKKQI